MVDLVLSQKNRWLETVVDGVDCLECREILTQAPAEQAGEREKTASLHKATTQVGHENKT